MSKFSERFKMLRASRKLSQQELADNLGTSKSSVNMYERGEREPGLEMLETIADYFNVDMDYLMGKSSIANRALEKESAPLTARGAQIDELIEKLVRLSPDNQQIVIDLIETMLKHQSGQGSG